LDDMSEAEQLEWLKTQIREYGLWIVGGIALGGLFIGGYRLWTSHVEEAGREASATYGQLREAFERNDRGQALAALGQLERDHASSPYVDQGRLLSARAYVQSGELDKAARELRTVADSSKDPELARIARLRLARVQIATKEPDAALATLGTADAGAFEPRYHEVRGDAYYAKGDKANALKEYRAAQATDRTGAGDHSLLELKISDLQGEAAAPASTGKTDARPPARPN
jgi:predicted negative regulator of RcsB-dependent stress response